MILCKSTMHISTQVRYLKDIDKRYPRIRKLIVHEHVSVKQSLNIDDGLRPTFIVYVLRRS